jgi:hypothetical protein
MGGAMQIEVSDAERELLIDVLERALKETRVEVRRTSTRDFHDKLLAEEQTLGDLLARIHAVGSSRP